MTRFFLSLILLAVALPALAAEPESVQVTTNGQKVETATGDVTVLPPTPAVVAEAEAERIRAEARQMRDETSNGSVIGRASMSSDDICGLKFDREATGRRGRQLAELYAECVRAEAVKIDAIGRANNTELALLLDRDLHSEGDESATGKAAPISALSDDEGGGLGYAGYGVSGVPYGASPFQAVQANALGWQAVQAGQLTPAPMPVVNNTPAPQITVKTVVKATETPTSQSVEDAELAAAKLAIEQAKKAAE